MDATNAPRREYSDSVGVRGKHLAATVVAPGASGRCRPTRARAGSARARRHTPFPFRCRRCDSSRFADSCQHPERARLESVHRPRDPLPHHLRRSADRLGADRLRAAAGQGGQLAEPSRVRLAEPGLAALAPGTVPRPHPDSLRRTWARPIRLVGTGVFARGPPAVTLGATLS